MRIYQVRKSVLKTKVKERGGGGDNLYHPTARIECGSTQRV